MLEWDFAGGDWSFRRDRGGLTALELRGADFLVAISLKNPKFSRRWLTACVRGINHLSGTGHFTIVDTPYINNILAAEPDKDHLHAEIKKLARIREETNALLKSVVSQCREPHYVYDWSDLANEVPAWITREILEAFWKDGKVRNLVLRQVFAVAEGEDHLNMERLPAFFLEEAPVLIHLYYTRLPGIVDIYPGPHAEFFWALDSGELLEELPLLSALASRSPGLTYAEMRPRP